MNAKRFWEYLEMQFHYFNGYTDHVIEKGKQMNKIVFDDGKEVKLSDETVKRLRKELLPEDKQLSVGGLRAVKNTDGVRIAILYGNRSLYKWDGNASTDTTATNAKATWWFSKGSVQEIIEGLQKLIEE